MKKITSCLLVLIGAASAALGQVQDVREYPVTVNVQKYGAVPNDAKDDTAAIQKAVNAAPARSVIYFPAGTYLVNDVQILNRRELIFRGDGRTATILKRSGTKPNSRVATMRSCADIVITALAFDANGIEMFGGFVIYETKRIAITDTRFFDSHPKPIPSNASDRYPYVFARGSVPCEDVCISGNIIDDLQLEVDYCHRAWIVGNTVSRPVNTSGIGLFTISDNTTMEDYVIAGNTVIDPVTSAGGIVVHLDPPTQNHCRYKNIQIVGNLIRYTKSARGDLASAVRIGTGDMNPVTRGNVFDNITIRGNVVQVDPAVRYDFHGPILVGYASAKSGFTFDHLTVADNTIFYAGPTSPLTIYAPGVAFKQVNNIIVKPGKGKPASGENK